MSAGTAGFNRAARFTPLKHYANTEEFAAAGWPFGASCDVIPWAGAASTRFPTEGTVRQDALKPRQPNGTESMHLFGLREFREAMPRGTLTRKDMRPGAGIINSPGTAGWRFHRQRSYRYKHAFRGESAQPSPR